MNTWTHERAEAEAAAERTEAAEGLAEARFDAVHAQAQSSGGAAQALKTPEFREWMAARHATDAAWGAWSKVMDAEPPATDR